MPNENISIQIDLGSVHGIDGQWLSFWIVATSADDHRLMIGICEGRNKRVTKAISLGPRGAQLIRTILDDADCAVRKLAGELGDDDGDTAANNAPAPANVGGVAGNKSKIYRFLEAGKAAASGPSLRMNLQLVSAETVAKIRQLAANHTNVGVKQLATIAITAIDQLDKLQFELGEAFEYLANHPNATIESAAVTEHKNVGGGNAGGKVGVDVVPRKSPTTS